MTMRKKKPSKKVVKARPKTRSRKVAKSTKPKRPRSKKGARRALATRPSERRVAHVDTLISGVPDWAVGFAAGALVVGVIYFFKSPRA